MTVKRKRGGSLEDQLVKKMCNVILRYQESLKKSNNNDIKSEMNNTAAILQYARQTQPQYRRKNESQLRKAIDKGNNNN